MAKTDTKMTEREARSVLLQSPLQPRAVANFPRAVLGSRIVLADLRKDREVANANRTVGLKLRANGASGETSTEDLKPYCSALHDMSKDPSRIRGK